ncbi:YggT family protein [Lacticaseibacillus kribbianus]|uniref:YggT family protein n=1 Tax=Lacticaseibacillus kribbianus TaxID=2926292 RepID=UPI001CD5C068|nr:YggT family protein [Lacticaseibacillus kribbianus]
MILYRLYQVLSTVLEAYMLALVVYVLMSWFPGARESALGRFLARICEPFLRLFSFLPTFAGLDFSPLLAFFALGLGQRVLFWIFSALVTG